MACFIHPIPIPVFSLLLIILSLTLFSPVLAEPKSPIKPSPTSSTKPSSLFLPLKTQNIHPGSFAKSTNRLPFHHNVTLTVTLLVGSPAQPVSMVLDTGSELSWLHCKKAPGLTTTFEPLQSKSYTPLPCTSPTCKARTHDFSVPVSCDAKKLCHASVTYADATSMEGNLAMDTYRLGSSAVPGMVFGCMDSGLSSSSSLASEDAKTTGLLGMNRGSLSFISQMGYPKFSYCISGQDSSGVLLLGEAAVPWLKPLSYTPLVKISTPLPYFDQVAYSVNLEGIRVGTKLLSIPKSVLVPDHTGAGQTMVDSGTQFTFLLGPAYTALKNEFLSQTKGLLRVYEDHNYVFQGAMDLCYRVPLASQRKMPVLPTVTLLFRGAEMSVSGERLLYKVPSSRQVTRGGRGSDGLYCFTFGNSDLLGVESYIIGHHHQQNMWMEFDLERSRVGLAGVKCDMARQRLGL